MQASSSVHRLNDYITHRTVTSEVMHKVLQREIANDPAKLTSAVLLKGAYTLHHAQQLIMCG